MSDPKIYSNGHVSVDGGKLLGTEQVKKDLERCREISAGRGKKMAGRSPVSEGLMISDDGTKTHEQDRKYSA